VGRVRASLLALGIPLANLRYERVHEEGG
jgi:hypothetical protein